MKTRFTKIKFDGSKVRIEYEVERKPEVEPDEYALISSDLPTLEFIEALADLAQDVAGICELPESDTAKIAVRGVSLSHTNGILGACITGLKSVKTANAPLVLNTPHLPSEPYSDNLAEPTLPTATCGRIHVVIDHAQRYIDGERAQGDLLAATVTTAA
jgi:hypothetical protein